MKRVIGILVLLAPVLWLVGATTSAARPFQPVGFIQAASVVTVADHSSPTWTAADDLRATLRPNRRLYLPVGLSFPTTPVVVASIEASERDSALFHFELDSPVARLAHSWQFDCRTALEPRAPSFFLS
jgi:hypothetical protein